MAEVTYCDTTGVRRTIRVDPGDSVMQTAVKNGVPEIIGECGGALSCSTCHVYVDYTYYGHLGPVDDMEDEMLDGVADERRAGSRLSCQLHLSDGESLLVHTPQAQY